MERLCGTLEPESSRLTPAMGEIIFELFISLKVLKGFREFLPLKFVPIHTEKPGRSGAFSVSLPFALLPNRDAKMLALTGFHNCFKTPIHKWLQIVHDRSGDRIGKAVEADKVKLGARSVAPHTPLV